MEGGSSMTRLLKMIMGVALGATLCSHKTMSLVGMYEPKQPILKKVKSR